MSKFNVTLHWIRDPSKQPQVALCGQRTWGVREPVPGALGAHRPAGTQQDVGCARCTGRKPLWDLAGTDL